MDVDCFNIHPEWRTWRDSIFHSAMCRILCNTFCYVITWDTLKQYNTFFKHFTFSTETAYFSEVRLWELLQRFNSSANNFYVYYLSRWDLSESHFKSVNMTNCLIPHASPAQLSYVIITLYDRDRGESYHRDRGESYHRDRGESYHRDRGESYHRDRGESYHRDRGESYHRDRGESYHRDRGESYHRDRGESYHRDRGESYHRDTGES